MSTALVIASGMGSPIKPAFSMMEMVSLQIKPITTASLTKVEPITASSLQATSTISSVSPLRHRPFHPARDSSVPSLLFGLAWENPGDHKPRDVIDCHEQDQRRKCRIPSAELTCDQTADYSNHGANSILHYITHLLFYLPHIDVDKTVRVVSSNASLAGKQCFDVGRQRVH